MALPLEQYGLIGDCRTAALVGADGSIDWRCLPRFDSPACFAGCSVGPEHGLWRIAPVHDPRTVAQRYRGDTLIVETELATSAGAIRLVDFMSLGSEAADGVRMVEGVRGSVPARLDLTLRPDYGEVVPWVQRTQDGLTAIVGPGLWRLRSPVPLVNEQFTTPCTRDSVSRSI